MPLVEKSDYKPSWWMFNPHMQTILPSMFRKVKGLQYTRERIHLPDQDFLDLDWIKSGSDRLVIISHGLEGSSERHYVKGMARYFSEQAWDVLAWNCRSCSGEINKAPRLYHHAATDDLEEVINHAIHLNAYHFIALVGFSMGGSLTLKYLGERNEIHDSIKASAVFSVPCNLGDSAALLDQRKNNFYRYRFIKKLRKKIELKSLQYPELYDTTHLLRLKYFQEFDEIYTAPRHGFKSAKDFYDKASANNYISNIKTNTLILNAANDPFLTASCYPHDLAKVNEHVFLEIPKEGGHVGFGLAGNEKNYMEIQAYDFISNALLNS